MPTKTKLLENRNFVYSPESPANPAFSEYLDYADRLLREWHEVQEEQTQTPFESELGERKKKLDEAVGDFVDSFKDRYGIKSVEQDPTFLPAAQFFAHYRPLERSFSILHCNLDLPLHTVHRFETHYDLGKVNAALDEDTPLPWWQPGPHNRPCYLFGEWVWELKLSELNQSDEGIVLLFQQTAERAQQKFERLRDGYSGTCATACVEFVPEKVRVLVWRRARGKCAKCGGHEALEFDYVIPANRGGQCTPGNLQLLCGRCYCEKHAVT